MFSFYFLVSPKNSIFFFKKKNVNKTLKTKKLKTFFKKKKLKNKKKSKIVDAGVGVGVRVCGVVGAFLLYTFFITLNF